MRISDWSSDVCSSDLRPCDGRAFPYGAAGEEPPRRAGHAGHLVRRLLRRPGPCGAALRPVPDRKSVVSGKSVPVSVDLGGRRIIKKKTKTQIRRNEQIQTHNTSQHEKYYQQKI